MAFENLIGNSKIKETLNLIAEKNNVLNGYMFIGIEGIGKKLFAIEFAKMLLCTENGNKPCNHCKSCIEFSGNNNPDFKIIEPDGNSIKIEQIRLMNSKIIEKPITSSRKVYIINDSQKMTVEAQNCLLKTLEEPPEYATLILICNNEAQMLNTIKSRCTKINFNLINENELKEYIEKRTNEKLNDNILRLSEGSIRKALELNEKVELYSNLEKFINKIEQMKKTSIFSEAELLYRNTDDIQEILNYMNIEFFEKGKTNEKYLNCIEYIEQAKRRLKANSNYNMTIDNVLLKIWEEINEEYSRS